MRRNILGAAATALEGVERAQVKRLEWMVPRCESLVGLILAQPNQATR